MIKLEQLIEELCPDGVVYYPLGEICKLVTGATPSKTKTEYWDNGTIPWMSSGEVNNKIIFETENKITQLGYDSASTTVVPIHSVVIALAGQGKTRGKVAITEIELCTNQSLCSIVCGNLINYKFLYYYLDSKYLELRSISNGDGSRGGLSLKILSPYQIPVPPLPVQSEIVRILDNFTELTTALTTALTAELIARKQQYEYYCNYLLTFSDNVSTVKLGDIATIKTGSKPAEILETATEFEYINAGTSNSGYVECTNCDGDTVTTPSRGQGGIGFVGYQKNAFWLGPLCYRIKSKDTTTVTNLYLYHYLKHFNEKILACKKEGGTPAVNASDLVNTTVEIPSFQEQERIVAILNRFDALCNDITEGLPTEIEARQKQYEYYRDKLLTFKEA